MIINLNELLKPDGGFQLNTITVNQLHYFQGSGMKFTLLRMAHRGGML